MLTVLAFLGVLLLVVMVHEFGHFSIAKLSGVRVLEFGMGFPPRLFGFRKGETLYSVNLLPIGGFVRLAGEEDAEEPGSFTGKPTLIRLAILASGSLMNILLPLVLLVIFFVLPKSVPVTDVVVLQVVENSPAWNAGIESGDIIVDVDGTGILNSSELRTAIQLRLGSASRWTVSRGGQLLYVSVIPRINPPPGEGSVGILPADSRMTVISVVDGSHVATAGLLPGDSLISLGGFALLTQAGLDSAITSLSDNGNGREEKLTVLRDGALVELIVSPSMWNQSGILLSVTPAKVIRHSVFQAIPQSVQQIWEILVMFRNEIRRWVSGGSPELTGPIGIAQITGEAAKSGPATLLFWTALLSVNLAIINLLPLPMLDGGRIVFVLLEFLNGGKPISARTQRASHFVGFVLLIGILVIVTANDLKRIFE